ncbi:zinc-binding dehydrogenase [Streptomyces sp. HC307]|uniref:zinc-binding dehydrogenase n=1 Tax=Streptomyces flavusporus TaxID=3385496 RepID=UPI00391745FB
MPQLRGALLRAPELGITFVAPDGRFGPQLADHARHAADGRLRVRIDQSYPLADAAKAQELGESGHPRGKLLLRPQQAAGP